MTPLQLLEGQLISADKKILRAEKDLEYLTKTVGNRISEIAHLKEQRKQISDAYIKLKETDGTHTNL